MERREVWGWYAATLTSYVLRAHVGAAKAETSATWKTERTG